MKKLHNEDVLALKRIFGDSLVYDYSGINEITRNIANYYEEKHFKPYIARKIMEEIYP